MDFRIIEMVEEFVKKYSEYRGAVRKLDGLDDEFRHFTRNNTLIIAVRGDDTNLHNIPVNEHYFSDQSSIIETVNSHFKIRYFIPIESFKASANPDLDPYDRKQIKDYYNTVLKTQTLKEEVTGLKIALKMVEKHSDHLDMQWKGGYLTSINKTPVKEWIAEMVILGEEV